MMARRTRFRIGALFAALLLGGGASTAFAQTTPSKADGSAGQAPAAPARMSAADMAALFEQKAGLGKEQDQVLGEMQALTTKGDGLKVEEQRLEQGKKDYDAHFAAAAAVCNGKPWEGAYAHCNQDQANLDAEVDGLNARIDAHQVEVDRVAAEARRLLDRQSAIEASLARIDAQLAAQRAFAQANKNCAGSGTLEAMVQCMEVEWDRAGDPGYTVPDPPAATRRTPEQAIEE